MGEVDWRRVNGERYEYAIQRGPHGDEFVHLLDGTCLRRPLTADAEIASTPPLSMERLRVFLRYEWPWLALVGIAFGLTFVI